VWQRDEGRCAFVGRTGRCRETAFLEFHHVAPYAAGGAATADNIQVRCRAHNQYEARLFFWDTVVRERPQAWVEHTPSDMIHDGLSLELTQGTGAERYVEHRDARPEYGHAVPVAPGTSRRPQRRRAPIAVGHRTLTVEREEAGRLRFHDVGPSAMNVDSTTVQG
jgi:hypothetical protein